MGFSALVDYFQIFTHRIKLENIVPNSLFMIDITFETKGFWRWALFCYLYLKLSFFYRDTIRERSGNWSWTHPWILLFSVHRASGFWSRYLAWSIRQCTSERFDIFTVIYILIKNRSILAKVLKMLTSMLAMSKNLFGFLFLTHWPIQGSIRIRK